MAHIKAIIDEYSERLNMDKVELYADEDFVASAMGEIIEVDPHSVGDKVMVSICNEYGIAHTFYHCDEVCDNRKLTKLERNAKDLAEAIDGLERLRPFVGDCL